MKKLILLGIFLILMTMIVSAFTVTEYKDKLEYSGKFLSTKWKVEVPITKVLELNTDRSILSVDSTITDYKTYLLTNYKLIWIDKTAVTTTTTTTKEITTTKDIIGTISPTTTIK